MEDYSVIVMALPTRDVKTIEKLKDYFREELITQYHCMDENGVISMAIRELNKKAVVNRNNSIISSPYSMSNLNNNGESDI